MLIFNALLTAVIAQSSPGAANTCQIENLNPATLAHLQMSKFGAVTRAPAAIKGLAISDLSTGNGGKVLGYTRIGIAYRSCGGSRDISKERRDAFRRFFFGKDANKLLSLKILVQPLNVERTTPLASIKRSSNKQTESWNTAIVNDNVLLPYFRVDRSSTVSIEVALRSDRSYSSTLAGSTLDIVERAAALINPATTLVTKENKERFNTAAAFVDGAVNGLLAAAVDEKVNSKVSLDSPTGRQILGVITLSVPMANNTFASARFPMQQIGQWEIYAEPYRPSMLADLIEPASIPRDQIAVAGVLNFLVDDKKTLREALAASKSLSSARDALVAATADAEVTNKARTLCRAVAAEADGMGIAPIDGGAAAWAYLADLAFATKKHAAAEGGCRDVEHYPSG